MLKSAVDIIVIRKYGNGSNRPYQKNGKGSLWIS